MTLFLLLRFSFAYHSRANPTGIEADSLSRRGTEQVFGKIASDWRKPDGLFVIQPDDVETFLLPLPVGRLTGVGKVTGEKLGKLGILTVGDLRRLDLPVLEHHFASFGVRLHELARGVDDREVVPDRPTKSISVEDTFEQDVQLAETELTIRRLAEKLWSSSRKESHVLWSSN